MTLTAGTIRRDLKCGKGSISQGEKCHVGPARAAEPAEPVAPKKKRAPNATNKEKFLKKAGLGLSIGGAAYTVGSALTGRMGHAYGGLAAMQAGAAASNYGMGMEAERKGQKAKAKRLKGAVKWNLLLGAVSAGQARIEGKKWENFKAEQKQRREWYEQRAQNAGREYQSGNYNPGGTRPNQAVKDPFKDLGVSSKASDADIKAAWKKAMAQHHPDRGGDPEKAKTINAAYQEIMRRRGKRDSIYADGFDIDWSAIDL